MGLKEKVVHLFVGKRIDNSRLIERQIDIIERENDALNGEMTLLARFQQKLKMQL